MEKQPFERPFIKKLQSGMPSKFGMKMGFDPITEIDGLNVKDLIGEYGSPLYIISEKTIRKTLNTAKRAFTTRYPKVQFTWSYKTNYLDAVAMFITRRVVGLRWYPVLNMIKLFQTELTVNL